MKWNLVIGWVVGVLSLVILLSIPSDPDSRVLLRFSLARIGMITLLGLGVALLSILAYRALTDNNWLDLTAARLITLSTSDVRSDLILWGAGIGLFSSAIYFWATYFTNSPFLTRLLPLIFWIAFLCLQILIFSIRFGVRPFTGRSEAGGSNLRTHTIGIIFILLIALGVRSIVLFTYEIPIEKTRRQDIAIQVAEQREFAFCNSYFPFCEAEDLTASVEPLPILIFAAIFVAFTTQAAYIGVLLQMILSLASIGMVYLLIRLLLKDSRPAFLGAFLWGVYFPLVLEIEASLKGEAFFILFLLLGMFFLVLGLEKNRVVIWLLAGLCFGLAALSRSVLIYFVPVLAILLFAIPIHTLKQRILSLGLIIFSFVLVLTPWTLRNYFVFDAFIPGVTLSGYNLYRHNHILEKDDYLRYVYVEEMRTAQQLLLTENEGSLRGDENEHEMDQLYRQEAIKIIANNPFRYLQLSLYRFIPLWTNYGVRYGYISDITWNLSSVVNLIFLGTAIMSIVRRRATRPPEIIPVVTFLIFYTLSYMMVNARMRFIIPLIPFVLIFSADQLVYLGSKWRFRFLPGLNGNGLLP